jgi:hypothetical protein
MGTLTSPARGSVDSSVFPMTYADAGGGSGPVSTATLRNIATRCRPPGSQTVADGFCFSRTMHHNRGGAQTSIQCVFSNWWATFNGEFPNTANLTLTAAVEYPIGVFTQMTWNLATSVVMTPGTNSVTDPCFVGIPDGARFWIRTYQVCPAGTLGIVTASIDRTANTMANELGQYSTTALTDFTLAGGGVGGSSIAYYPSAILGMSSRPSVYVVGDSRCAGLQDNPVLDIGLSGAGEICRSLTSTTAYCNAGFPTDQGATFVSTQATTGFRKALAQYHTHVHSQYGINDFIFSQTLAQLQATQAAIFASMPGKVYSLSTLPPMTTSTDAWATNGNQTITVSGTVAANRPAYNTWVLTKPLGIQNAFDVSGFCEEPTTPGKWKSPDISTWTDKLGAVHNILVACTGDGTHETPTMYGLIENSNTINPALIL